jgi:hypothetical protein
MLVITAALVWYVTKVFYTHSFTIKLAESGLSEVQCNHCSKKLFVTPENLRAPYYCAQCA